MAYHDEYLDLISASLDGALSPAEEEKLNAHLAQCPDCRALYDDLSALHAGLADLPPQAPPADMTERIMEAVAAKKLLPLPGKKNFQWQKWMASAAVLAIVIAGAWSWSRSSVGGFNSAVPMAAKTADEAGAAAPPSPETENAPSSELTVDVSQDLSTGAGADLPAPASIQSYGPTPAETPAFKESVSPRSGEAPVSPGPAGKISGSAEAVPETAVPEEPLLQESLPVAPRLFSAPPPPPEPQDSPVPETTFYDRAAQLPSNATEEPDATVPADDGELVPSSFALTSASMESPPPSVCLTSQEAVQALADYIYEFVEQVEPVALEDGEGQAWYLSSPTGVSGTAVLVEETELLFRFTYQDGEGGESLSYTVDKLDGTVLFPAPESSD